MIQAKEIKDRISSVRDTQKLTNAMYLIASAKMRRAKRELDQTRPYFHALQTEIKRIFRTVEDIDNQYFYPFKGTGEIPGAYGYLVITADKGLAGAYNQNVLREAEDLMSRHTDNRLFVVGEYGRQYFTAHNVPIQRSFLYTAQNPTIQRARDISGLLLELYQKKELANIFVVYTDLSGGMNASARSTRLLPFHRAQFTAPAGEEAVTAPFAFSPTVEKVLDSIIPSYMTGLVYSTLVDSFCCEQNARMLAMDAASDNTRKLLDELSVQLNHARQEAITQEITEIAAGARGQRRQGSGGSRI